MAVRHFPDPHILTETRVGNTLAWMKAIEFPDWMGDGLCGQQLDLSPEAWFPHVGPGRLGDQRMAKMAAEAKAVCGDCPVRLECLEYSFETDQRHGVWGGLTEYERRQLKARPKRRA